jgi:hypothetical protein
MPISEIRGDAAFMAFHAKLATVVVNATKLGKTGCCPLGAHPEAASPFPPSSEAQKGGWGEVPIDRLRAFIEGWHRNDDFELDTESLARPYFLLGRAYRDQFPGARI